MENPNMEWNGYIICRFDKRSEISVWVLDEYFILRKSMCFLMESGREDLSLCIK